jgi:uncharacterized membrane protein
MNLFIIEVVVKPPRAMPPIHPMLNQFTMVLIPISVFFDIAGLYTRPAAFRAVAWWTLLAAAIITPLTALTGWLWRLSGNFEPHWQLPIHAWIGTAAAAILILVAVWRGSMYHRDQRPGPAYIVLGAILLAVVGVQGELGGSMAYGRGLVLRAEPRERQDPAVTPEREAGVMPESRPNPESPVEGGGTGSGQDGGQTGPSGDPR